MGKILVATDFSEAANNAMVYAVQLAEQTDQDLVVLYAHKEDEGDYGIREKFERLEHDYIYGRGFSCTFDTRIGGVVESINDVVTEYDIDLVIVGTRGFEGEKELEVGSLTAKLVDDPYSPMISVPKHCKNLNFKKLALASDFSGEDHQEALKIVYQLAKMLDSELKIIYVHSHKENGASKDVKHRFEQIFSLVPHTYYEILSDNVVGGLIQFCDDEEIDLLITLREKHRNKEKLLSGSISKSLSLRGKIPLMVIPVGH